jgi:hypothetical protein
MIENYRLVFKHFHVCFVKTSNEILIIISQPSIKLTAIITPLDTVI